MKRAIVLPVLAGAAILVGLYLTSLYSYVLFHTIAELVGIAIAFGVFLFAWNSRRFIKNNYLLFLGIAYVFVACIAIMHTLAYQGMGIFPGFTADQPTQLWIASRYLLGLSYFIAPLLLGRRLNLYAVVVAYSAATALLLLSILYWNIFPACYVEGVGLTPFKKISELVISGILVLAAAALWRQRRHFEKPVHLMLTLSLVFTVLAELSFTQYVSVYGPANLIGHLLNVTAFFTVYQAVIVTGFRRPVEFLFRDLSAINKALGESEAKYRNIFENASEGIFQITPAGKLLSANPSFARMLGYGSPQELMAQVSDVGQQLYANPEDRERLKVLLEAQGRISGFEAELKRRDGERIWIAVNSHVVRDEQGRTLYYEGTNEDITAHKKADQIKDDFIGMVSHELRTPLTVMMGSLATARTPGLSPADLKQLLEGAAESAAYMADIVDNLLELSRYQSDRLSLSLGLVDIREVMTRVTRRVSATHPRHLFLVEVPDDLPQPRADRLRVERILQNLADNAAKYSPEGSEVRLQASCGNGAVAIAVRDCGHGLSQEQQERLFEPFGRLDKRSGVPGLGLGLIVCKRLAEAHGGNICVESAPGKGSTFTLKLPLERLSEV